MKKRITPSHFIIILSILQLTLGAFNTSAQVVLKRFGLELDPAGYDSLPTMPLYSIAKNENLPDRIDLSPYCPPIRNQGSIESCVGWSLGYGVMTISKAISQNIQDQNHIANNAYSALFIYNQIPKEGCVPISFLQALYLAKQKGNCLFMNFDAQIGFENCGAQPSSTLINRAQRDTLIDFHKLFDLNELPSEKVRKIRSMLIQKRPVLIGVVIPDDFAKIPKGVKYYIPSSEISSFYSHAMVVVGYDHTRQAIRVFNSWGVDWADNGYVWIPYEVLGKYCAQAYVLSKPTAELSSSLSIVPSSTTISPEVVVPKNQEPPAAPTQGPSSRISVDTAKVAFQPTKSTVISCQLIAIDEEKGSRLPVAMQGHAGIYHTLPGQWPLKQLFQIEINNQSCDMYLYSFSVDPWFNVKMHWPRQSNLDPVKFGGMNESAFLPASNQTLTIPEDDTALEMKNVGTEVLYILLSNRPIGIQQFRTLMERLRNYKSNYQLRLTSVLGDYLIPSSFVSFDPDRMAFQAAIDELKESIIPLVLEVTIKP